jgi:hypothetical protein
MNPYIDVLCSYKANNSPHLKAFNYPKNKILNDGLSPGNSLCLSSYVGTFYF